ncbi:MAG: PAS domain S-box protein, partial [Chloroflexi bacterium]|nr:PAS domain S-box protein [Chloroflexota bacterium]
MDIPEVNQLRSEVAALRRRVAELEAASASHRDVEVALGAARQRLYDVLETLPVYVILLSADYHVPFANRFFRERFGDAGDKRCYEYLFGYSEPCKNCETYRVMETQAPHRWEWVGPDTRTYDIYDYPFKDSDGSPLILEVGIDITERINAEAALRESNETLERRVAERTAELHREKLTSEKVIEVMSGVFYIFDAQGRLIKWNKNFERVSGYSAEELARMTLTDFFVDEDKRLIEQRGAEVFARGESWAEAEFVSKDGHKIPYYFTGLLVEMDGAPCLIGMGLDITERKRAEDVLREAKADLERRVEERTAELHAASLYARSLIEASLDPMVTISPQGKITDVN